MTPEATLAIRMLFYVLAFACIVYIVACARDTPGVAVYLDAQDVCRSAATGNEAPAELCAAAKDTK